MEAMIIPHSVMAAAYRCVAKYIGDNFWDEDDWYTLNQDWELNIVREDMDDLYLVKANVYNVADRQQWLRVAEFAVNMDTDGGDPEIVPVPEERS